ncbi:ArnT family glycosyltransferase [Pusillimonas sp.]|uniref:ArnT family glycosyltransferase n=1 Tax=Pusillimonas sp. TaxID=3040095 RepID=UPI0037CB1C2E
MRARPTWLIALMAFAWFAASTWSWPLLLPDEGRYVGVAWGMLSHGEWGVPLLNGLPFFHKPPLFYWLTAASLWTFGPNEWAARMASVLGATLMVASVYWFLKAHATRLQATIAALVLAVQPFVFGASHYANLDMLVAGIITATIVLAASAALRLEVKKPYRRVLALAYVALALGFLAKGLIGIVLPAGVIGLWLLGRRRFGVLLGLMWLPGLALLLAVSLPWMAAMQARYEGFFDYYILYQHFHRYLEGGFNNARPFWFYLPVLILLTLPWSTQLWRLFEKGYWGRDEGSALRGLMVVWFLVVFVFFSIPNSKLAGYVLPCSPPVAYFIADIFGRRLQNADQKAGRLLGVCTMISAAICLAAVMALSLANRPSAKTLAARLDGLIQAEDQIVMLDRMHYDLNFYLRSARPAWVVADWRAEDIHSTDNWRKELFDAAPFAPVLASQLLVTHDDLLARVCTHAAGNHWLVGRASALGRLPEFRLNEPEVSTGVFHAWRIGPDVRDAVCVAIPQVALE